MPHIKNCFGVLNGETGYRLALIFFGGWVKSLQGKLIPKASNITEKIEKSITEFKLKNSSYS
jgi:hypothetical protein